MERLLESYRETTFSAEMAVIGDPDDEETYEGIEWKNVAWGVLSPREPLSGKLNRTADAFAGDFDALMWVADDCVFRTPDWDKTLMGTLGDMGGTGMVVPSGTRRSHLTEVILISSDIVRELGFFANPALSHFGLENSWAELGSRSGLIRYCPEVIVDHCHYTVDRETEYDQVYREAEDTWGQADLRAFSEWQVTAMSSEVSRLRRAFSRDVAWVLGKI